MVYTDFASGCFDSIFFNNDIVDCEFIVSLITNYMSHFFNIYCPIDIDSFASCVVHFLNTLVM